MRNITLVNLADCDEPEEYIQQISTLPCLVTLVVGGEHFADEHLAAIQQVQTLRLLALESAPVSPAAVAMLEQSLPQVTIYRSQRRVAEAIAKSGVGAWSFGGALSEPALLEQQIVLGYVLEANVRQKLHLAQLGGSKVERLDLDKADITDNDLVHLAGMKQLRTIYLTNRPISDAGLSHLKGLDRLELLDLSGTKITDSGLHDLVGLANLKELYLHGTRITDSAVASLVRLENLTVLAVSYTKISTLGNYELRKALPKCEIRD